MVYFLIFYLLAEFLVLYSTIRLLRLNINNKKIILLTILHAPMISIIKRFVSPPYELLFTLFLAIILIKQLFKIRIFESILLSLISSGFYLFAFNMIIPLRDIIFGEAGFFQLFSSLTGTLSLIIPFMLLFLIIIKIIDRQDFFLKKESFTQLGEKRNGLMLFNMIIISTVGTLCLYYLSYQYLSSGKTTELNALILASISAFYIPLHLLMISLKFLEGKTTISEVRNQYAGLSRINMALENQHHDFKQHLQLLMTLIQMSKYEQALNYMRNITEDLKELKKIKKTGISALDGLLIYKDTLANKANISLKINILNQLNRLPLNDSSICRVIGNLIDNAIEYLKDKPNIEKYVELTIKELDEVYLINVANPVEDEDIFSEGIEKLLNRGQSSKGNERGLGLSIIYEIMNKINGRIEPTLDHKEGVLSFNLKLPKKVNS